MASHKMYNERKRILLDTVDETIEKLEKNQYNLGLRHKQNVLIPKDAIASFKDDKISINRNLLVVTRTVKKLSKDLNYDIILIFDDKLFNENKLEHVRSKSLAWYINNKIVPIIIEDLREQKRSTEVLLRIREPNGKELNDRNKLREENEERNYKKRMFNDIINEQDNKKSGKPQKTQEQKRQKWLDLRESNKANYLSKLGFYSIDITYKQGKQKQPLRTLKRKDISSFNGFKQTGSVFNNLISLKSQQYRIVAMNRRLDKNYDADDEDSLFSYILK